MRLELPIAYVPQAGRVLVTTWALCNEAGSDDEVFGPTQHPFNTVYGDPNVMSLTGPAHRNLRNSLNAPFRPRAVNAYRESALRATATRNIDAIRHRGAAEVCGELLEPISQRAVGDVLGFTDVDDDTNGRWFRGYAAYLVDFGRDARSRNAAEPSRPRCAPTSRAAFLFSSIVRTEERSPTCCTTACRKGGPAPSTT